MRRRLAAALIGDMPPRTYRLLHSQAALSEADRETLRAWTQASAGP
jgi:hypothetical protein